MGMSRRAFRQGDDLVIQRACCTGSGEGVTGSEGMMRPKLFGGQQGRLSPLRDDAEYLSTPEWRNGNLI